MPTPAHRTRQPRVPALPTAPPAVAAVFATYPQPLRRRLEALRRLILDTARTTPRVGALEETLKWGQPSYLTTESGSGSTIRIDRINSEPDHYALYVHCQTGLIAIFRDLYPELTYGGKRCVVLETSADLPEKALRHCIALALTYHSARRKAHG